MSRSNAFAIAVVEKLLCIWLRVNLVYMSICARIEGREREAWTRCRPKSAVNAISSQETCFEASLIPGNNYTPAA